MAIDIRERIIRSYCGQSKTLLLKITYESVSMEFLFSRQVPKLDQISTALRGSTPKYHVQVSGRESMDGKGYWLITELSNCAPSLVRSAYTDSVKQVLWGFLNRKGSNGLVIEFDRQRSATTTDPCVTMRGNLRRRSKKTQCGSPDPLGPSEVTMERFR